MACVVGVSWFGATIVILSSAMTGYAAPVPSDDPRPSIDLAAEDAGLPAGIRPQVLTWRRAYMQRVRRRREAGALPGRELATSFDAAILDQIDRHPEAGEFPE